MMTTVFWVGIGSAVGGMLRYGISVWTMRLGWISPVGILICNGVGSFLIGLGAAILQSSLKRYEPMLTPLFLVGFCGGFTTFSSFSLQTLSLFQSGKPALAFANVLSSVTLCLAAAWCGWWVASGK